MLANLYNALRNAVLHRTARVRITSKAQSHLSFPLHSHVHAHARAGEERPVCCNLATFVEPFGHFALNFSASSRLTSPLGIERLAADTRRAPRSSSSGRFGSQRRVAMRCSGVHSRRRRHYPVEGEPWDVAQVTGSLSRERQAHMKRAARSCCREECKR